MPQPGTSARTQLIKTRRGTWVDESLLPAARQECLDILRTAAREAVGEGTCLPGWISGVSDSMDWDVDQLSMERLTRKPTPAEEKMEEEIEEAIDALPVRGDFEGLAPWEHFEFAMHIRKRIRSKYETRIAREVEEVRKKNHRP